MAHGFCGSLEELFLLVEASALGYSLSQKRVETGGYKLSGAEESVWNADAIAFCAAMKAAEIPHDKTYIRASNSGQGFFPVFRPPGPRLKPCRGDVDLDFSHLHVGPKTGYEFLAIRAVFGRPRLTSCWNMIFRVTSADATLF